MSSCNLNFFGTNAENDQLGSWKSGSVVHLEELLSREVPERRSEVLRNYSETMKGAVLLELLQMNMHISLTL